VNLLDYLEYETARNKTRRRCRWLAEVFAMIDIAAWICHDESRRAGWYHNLDGSPKNRNVPEMLCLVHSEISEALEGYRKGQMDKHLPHRSAIEVELADALIRIFDLAEHLDLSLGEAMAEKLLYNRTRTDHKPAARGAVGGKAF
jgi:NTP pyrophosphatase (non-canonical NTP hydrolase)